MKDFLATILALLIIMGTVWGSIFLFISGVNFLSSMGIPQGLLYFSAGIVFAFTYKKIGRWFANYCDTVWETLCNWIVWR